jgi:conjugal transfer pilin signal peptidase TrbI
MKRRTRTILIGTSLGVSLACILSQTCININHSPSLGYKAFLCSKWFTPKRGNFVSIQGHPTAYFEELHYTKFLRGRSGDIIQIFQNKMFVGGHFVGAIRTTTRDGKPLHPLKAKYVPKGYVFVSADNPRSFDSRYEEFGLVKESCITATCIGLWKTALEENK